MQVNKNELSIKDAVEFSQFEKLLMKRRENNMLLSDYQISVLSNNGINYIDFNNFRDLLFAIENYLDNDYDEELDQISLQIAEYIYYNETKK